MYVRVCVWLLEGPAIGGNAQLRDRLPLHRD